MPNKDIALLGVVVVFVSDGFRYRLILKIVSMMSRRQMIQLLVAAGAVDYEVKVVVGSILDYYLNPSANPDANDDDSDQSRQLIEDISKTRQ